MNVMNVRNIFYSVGVGASFLVASQNVRAAANQEILGNTGIEESSPVQDDKLSKSDEALLKEQIKVQNEKLQALLNLPLEKSNEISKSLNDLTKFYQNLGYDNFQDERGFYAPASIKLQRSELLNPAKAQFQKLFERCLNELQSKNSETKETSAHNLDALSRVLPSDWKTSISICDLIDSKKHLESIFHSVLQAPSCDEKILELYTSVGLTLLSFFQSEEYIEKYAQGLVAQIHTALEDQKNIEVVKRKHVILEKAVRQLVDYFDHNFHSHTRNVLLPLIPSYSKLIEANNSNPNFLTGAIEAIGLLKSQERWSSTDVIVSKQYTEEILALSNITLEGVSKVALNKELVKKIFILMQDFRYNSLDLQASLVDLLSKHYFSKSKIDAEVLIDFFTLATKPSLPFQQEPNFTMSRYMVLKLIKDNPEYFRSNVEEIIGKLKQPRNSKEEINAINCLRELTFAINFEIKSKSDHTTNSNIYPDDLLKEADKWLNETIMKPALEALISKLKEITITTNTIDGELHIKNNDVWDTLDGCITTISYFDFGFAIDAANTLQERLKNEQNPYVRERCYKTLGSNTNYQILLNGLLKEESPQAIRGISCICAQSFKYVAGGIIPAGYVLELQNNRNISEEDIKRLKDLSAEDLTLGQKLILASIRIVSGDIEFAKTLLGAEKSNPKEIEKLQHNAFLFLAYTVSEYPEYFNPYHPSDEEIMKNQLKQRTYKELVAKLLEENLENNILKFDRLHPERLGEKVAALIYLYENCFPPKVGKEASVQEKLVYLNNLLFGNQDSIFKRWENTLFEEAIKGRKDKDLEPGEDPKVRYPKEWREVRSQMNILRIRMAEGVLHSACDKGLLKLKDHLVNCLPGGHYSNIELEDPYKYLSLMYNWVPTQGE